MRRTIDNTASKDEGATVVETVGEIADGAVDETVEASRTLRTPAMFWSLPGGVTESELNTTTKCLTTTDTCTQVADGLPHHPSDSLRRSLPSRPMAFLSWSILCQEQPESCLSRLVLF